MSSHSLLRGDLPDPGIEPRFPALLADFFFYHLSHQGSHYLLSFSHTSLHFVPGVKFILFQGICPCSSLCLDYFCLQGSLWLPSIHFSGSSLKLVSSGRASLIITTPIPAIVFTLNIFMFIERLFNWHVSSMFAETWSTYLLMYFQGINTGWYKAGTVKKNVS